MTLNQVKTSEDSKATKGVPPLQNLCKKYCEDSTSGYATFRCPVEGDQECISSQDLELPRKEVRGTKQDVYHSRQQEQEAGRDPS